MSAMGDERWDDWQLQAEEPSRRAPTRRGRSTRCSSSTSGWRSGPRTVALGLQAQRYAFLQKSARGQYLPQLGLDAGPTWAGGSLGQLVPNLSAVVSLSYPLLGMNPFAVHGQARQAAAQRRRSRRSCAASASPCARRS